MDAKGERGEQKGLRDRVWHVYTIDTMWWHLIVTNFPNLFKKKKH